MKLLLDENLSPDLVRQLAETYPDSQHVDLVRLHGQPDERIWSFARGQGYVLVSKDSDFRELSSTHGSPPKVVWLTVGNAGTVAIREVLVGSQQRVERFVQDPEEALLVLTLPERDEA